MITVLLADDHSILRKGIRNLLEREPDIRIVGEAEKITDIPELLSNNDPQILLTDSNGLQIAANEIAQRSKSKKSGLKMMLLTTNDHLKFIDKAFKAGVSAYLLKNISAEELVFAIRQVNKGGQYLCNELSLRLLDESLATLRLNDTANERHIELSEREISILKLMAEGFTNQEIADKLFTSKRTVEGHRRAMIDNANVKNTAALIKYAVKRKIID